LLSKSAEPGALFFYHWKAFAIHLIEGSNTWTGLIADADALTRETARFEAWVDGCSGEVATIR